MWEGYFLLKALRIADDGEIENCYIDIILPERISEMAYLSIDGLVVRKWKPQVDGEIIPAVAIEGNGDYELYYSRRRPEIGLDVLYRGLRVAKKRAPIAQDLAYILRDENRIEEAITAFSIVIDEGEPNEFTFSERAQLFEKIGAFEKAKCDFLQSEEMTPKNLRRLLANRELPKDVP